MSTSPADSKIIIVAGCEVTLTFCLLNTNQWVVDGSFACGIDDQRRTTVFHTAPTASRDEAEKLALELVGRLAGNNTPAVQGTIS
jgi:hypothetical protein